VQAITHRSSRLPVPVRAVAIFFWLIALAIGMIVVFAVGAVIFMVRLTARIMVMVCRNLFRAFPG